MSTERLAISRAEGVRLVVFEADITWSLANGYGLAPGEFEILSGIPNEYAQGIYAKTGTSRSHTSLLERD